MTEIFQRLPEVETRVGLRLSAIYLAIKENRFPKPVKLGLRAVAWTLTDISRLAARTDCQKRPKRSLQEGVSKCRNREKKHDLNIIQR